MECPKCFHPMETVNYQTICVQRCTGCQGLWFEMLAERKLAELPGSEAIDIGSAREGRRYDDVRKVDCPACRTPMVRLADPRQHHLWYESCNVCNGVFFDAGEFRDFKEHTVLDFFEDLFTRQRD